MRYDDPDRVERALAATRQALSKNGRARTAPTGGRLDAMTESSTDATASASCSTPSSTRTTRPSARWPAARYSSPYHFSRQLSRGAGEPPVAMRRRVMLERAAWQIRSGASVTDAAFAAGYESVEGFGRAFARAFGHPPSATAERAGSHWLPAPNGIHFHPPMSLWVAHQRSNR